jgi:hypothetical protein
VTGEGHLGKRGAAALEGPAALEGIAVLEGIETGISTENREQRTENRERGCTVAHRSLFSVKRLVLVALFAACAACAACASSLGAAPGAPPGPRCTGGVITDPADLTRRAGCAAIDGDLAIAGAAIADLGPLAAVREIRGDLTLGPTSRLIDASALGALESVAGDLVAARNFELGGLYLGRLARVDGAVIIERNVALLSASLHNLTSVGGPLACAGNASLERLDLSALREVGGDLTIDVSGDVVIALPDSVAVRGKRHTGGVNEK